MKKKNCLIIVALILFTVVIAIIRVFTGIPKPTAGTLTLIVNNKETMVDPSKASKVEVSGTTVNSKGDKKEINTSGYALKDVITLSGAKDEDYTSVKVTASDEFSATLTKAEIDDGQRAFLIGESSDKGDVFFKLIVFGDSDSKRQVKNVARIELIK
ncbi:MAG: hypothetical protein E7241_01940 [Lachnospiraceae bacterium]|nr:hypothetical protein [Lachnospiraceae bacterium]